MAEEKIGVCEKQQIGNDSSTTWPGRIIKGQASDRFLTEIFQDGDLAGLTSMRLMWMYIDGGYVDKEDSNDPNKGKATGCNLTNGVLTKDLVPKIKLYNYLLEGDKFLWGELPLVNFIEYKGNDPNLRHNVGFGEGEGWSTTVNDKSGYMIYGPYVSNLPKTTFAVVSDVVITTTQITTQESLGWTFSILPPEKLSQVDITIEQKWPTLQISPNCLFPFRWMDVRTIKLNSEPMRLASHM